MRGRKHNPYCTTCGVLKTKENTHMCSKVKSGMQSKCKECQKKKQQTELAKSKHREYYIKNKDKIKAYHKIYMESYIQTKQNKLKNSMSKRIKKELKEYNLKKTDHFINLLGCNISFFIKYFEAMFLPGMSWNNRAYNTWHIDHIIPCALFDLSDPEQQKKCFHYTNLQPLWALDNIKKGARSDYSPNSSAPYSDNRPY